MLCNTRWRRIVAVLVALVAGLQILHMSLVNQLETSKAARKRAQGSQRLLELYSALRDVIHAAPVRLDPSGQYSIVYGVLGNGVDATKHRTGRGGDVSTATPGATLVSQCSANHLHHIAHLGTRWSGPVSVAVFVSPSPSSSSSSSSSSLEHRVAVVIELLLWLHQCVPSMRHNVTIHLVTPFGSGTSLGSGLRLPEKPPLSSSSSPFSASSPQDFSICGNVAERVHQELSAAHNYAVMADGGMVRYPGNLLRNVALATVTTSHVLVVDIDMLPSAELYTTFNAFLHKQKQEEQRNNNNNQGQLLVQPPPVQHTDTDASSKECVYVVPAFEIQPNLALPQDKDQLLSLWTQNKVRPFYGELCEKCQRPTNYEQWRALTGSRSKEVNVGYEVAWLDPWEPFFIAPRSMPQYDERFKQYGFNRISQVCELHVAGYKFCVLDNAFLVHKGFKTSDSFHAGKDLEQEQNRILFRQFKEELKTKYPQSQRRCY